MLTAAARFLCSHWLIACAFLLLLCVGLSAEDIAHPAATAAQWVAAPDQAAAAGQAQATTTTTAAASAVWWNNVIAWAAGAAGLLIAIGKLLPGAAGPVAQVLGTIYDATVAKSVKDAETKQAALAAGMLTAAHLIQLLPAGSSLDALKAKLANRLPSDALDAINQWITAQEAARGLAAPAGGPIVPSAPLPSQVVPGLVQAAAVAPAPDRTALETVAIIAPELEPTAAPPLTADQLASLAKLAAQAPKA